MDCHIYYVWNAQRRLIFNELAAAAEAAGLYTKITKIYIFIMLSCLYNGSVWYTCVCLLYTTYYTICLVCIFATRAATCFIICDIIFLCIWWELIIAVVWVLWKPVMVLVTERFVSMYSIQMQHLILPAPLLN